MLAIIGAACLLKSQVFHETGNYELKYREAKGPILKIELLCLAFALRWSRLSEQIFRIAKWSLCRG